MKPKVYIASDHAGFVKKNKLAELLSKEYQVVDLGPEELNPEDDYPVFAERIGNAVVEDPGSLGIIMCKSGEGAAMAANKIDGVRAALVWQPHLAVETRSDNDSNVLALPADELSLSDLSEIIDKFLTTPFSGAERHKRRIAEIEQIENEQTGTIE
ncbi:RpiB/LacA/LacB family sugar-phosphate isomerase [Candidatus Saccharibacteria bacterium]|nr:RpiB/LacA/LacB family sugar-phosphate isomerase [Candidatus Saccharibacteria bacterium]